MQAALLTEPVLTADESPVEVVTPAKDPQTGEPVPGAPHVMVLRTPDERLVWLTALDSRRHDEVTASLRTFTGYLIVDGVPRLPETAAHAPATTTTPSRKAEPGCWPDCSGPSPTILDAITRALTGNPRLPQHTLA